MAHVTFIHGMCNKPAADPLLALWRNALAGGEGGLNLGNRGVTSRMVYWADVLYPEPCLPEAVSESVGELVARDQPVDLSWRGGLSGDEREWVESLAGQLKVDAPIPDDEEPVADVEAGMSPELERIPLPWWIKKEVMKSLLRDVHHYLFNTDHSPRPGVTYRVRDEIRRRAIEALKSAGEVSSPRPHVVVSHSMGTIVAYDCLKRVADCPTVDALLTIGSPLGLDEVQDKLKPEGSGQPGWSRDDGFPKERVTGDWTNVYDPLDVVAAFDPALAGDYRKAKKRVVDDVNEPNWGRWRHDIAKYLAGRQLRSTLGRVLGQGR